MKEIERKQYYRALWRTRIRRSWKFVWMVFTFANVKIDIWILKAFGRLQRRFPKFGARYAVWYQTGQWPDQS